MRHFLKNLLGLSGNLPVQHPSAFASLERAIATARHAHASARRALALAMAEEAREAERRAVLTAKVSELERRAVQALRAGCEDLAAQAAEAIGAMTTEIDASRHGFVRDVMAPPAEQLIERMAETGLGDPVRPNAADVLARLRRAAGLPVMPLLKSTSNPQ